MNYVLQSRGDNNSDNEGEIKSQVNNTQLTPSYFGAESNATEAQTRKP